MTARPRRGVALLVALVALLLIGALVTAALYRVQSDIRLAREGMARRRADVGAERALRLALTATSSATARALPVGGALTSTDATDGITTTVVTVRVDSTLAWVAATASAPSVRGVARARLGISAAIAAIGIAPLQPIPGDAWTPVF